MTVSFNPYSTASLLLLFTALFFLYRKKTPPVIPFSSFEAISPSSSAKTRFFPFAQTLSFAPLVLFGLAFCDVHVLGSGEKKKQEPVTPKKGVALYLVIDQSGSMGDEIVYFPSEEEFYVLSKMELLKNVTRDFIWGNPKKGLQGRQGDLVGFVTFARTAHVQVPLTLDRKALENALTPLSVVKNKEEDGTALGYALYKTAHVLAATKLFAKQQENRAPYEIQGAAIIAITDGFQDPNPLDRGNRLRNLSLEEAAQYAEDKGIRLYIVGVDPRMAIESFQAERNLLTRVTEQTGGKFFLATDAKPLEQIYREIDQLEKGIIRPHKPILQPPVTRIFSFFPWFISLGLVALLVSLVLETMLWKTFP